MDAPPIPPEINRKLAALGYSGKLKKLTRQLANTMAQIKYREITKGEQAAAAYGAPKVTKLMAEVVAIYRKADPTIADAIAAYFTATLTKDEPEQARH